MPELRSYQREALDFLDSKKRVIYADAAGSGKTATTLAWIEKLEGRTLVLAPTDICHQWVGQAEIWAPSSTSVLARGPHREYDTVHTVVVTNYETARLDIRNGRLAS